jgi:23S rRNA (guanine2445-N2)-methyltransferase / 23S rRNA (guanine2069-N7)-methyltransferase
MPDFFATCPKGLEYLLVAELQALGAASVREVLAGVHFSGEMATAYRACLWSRLASRVLMPLSRFDAADEEALYHGVEVIDWSRHLAAEGTLAIDAISQASRLTHTRYLEQKAKDAIVDQFRMQSGTRPSVDTHEPDLRLNLLLRKDQATLSLDLSGSPLHRRGYRSAAGAAPLKENLAAAMLLRAGWPELAKQGRPLVDPMCGSGTLLIEAAWIAADHAPGLNRTHFGFNRWLGHDAQVWSDLLEEARIRASEGLETLGRQFFGYDNDPRVLAIAAENAARAGVDEFMVLARRSLAELVPPPQPAPAAADDAEAANATTAQSADGESEGAVAAEPALRGLLISNPPYDERLAADPELYALFGTRLKAGFAGWRVALLVAEGGPSHALGLRPDKRYKLFNGALACELLLLGISPPRDEAQALAARPLSEGAQMLRNRLVKNIRQLRKFVAREQLECWRAYDADLPEYAAAIDVYGEHLHVQEYAAPASVDENLARTRLREIVQVAADVFGVPRERVHLKTRAPQTRTRRYTRMDSSNARFVVHEGGLAFWVNLDDYLDSGLFLDHRPLRLRVGRESRDLRVLNLFCYTGAVTVHAAAGGARETVSVDLSQTYLQWAADNLALNDLDRPQHRLVQADVMAYMREERSRYDLIFVDPPTFSNSKRMQGWFDVQRDHIELLKHCVACLAPGGLILFSNNFRRFKLDEAALGGFAQFREITPATIAEDFRRDPRIHRAWEIRALT